MNPFDAPPAGSPVSSSPPATGQDPRNRGRMALVALLSAGLLAGGIAGVSALASADDPEVALPAATPDTTPSDAPVDEGSQGGEDTPSTNDEGDDVPADDNQIVLDDGDGDPIVIDLGDLDAGTIARVERCLPALDFSFDEFEPGDLPFEIPADVQARLDEFLGDLDRRFGEFEGEIGDVGDVGLLGGGSVTISGPDGVSVVDLGENGSVTVTKDDGGITIETDGDATVSELSDLFGDFGTMFDLKIGADGELGDWFDEQQLDELLEALPQLDELADIESIDPAELQACIDEAIGN